MEGQLVMKELVFNRILIADILRKTARYQEFSKGFNVITSSDNHVGKSSLIKSLYYALGSEIEFDSTWDKDSKIYIVDFSVDDKKYRIARFSKRFALFEGNEMILLTGSVTKELSKKFEELFGFGVYLPNKNNKKVELAPSVFMFMPYYIDQDRGWAEIYDSFSRLDQYTKDDRIKSLYYHLGIYNKNTIELMAKKDDLSSQLEQLVTEGERLQIVINTLSDELKNIVPAENIEELDRNLAVPKEKISSLVKEIGKKRNEIQKLETAWENHKYQLAAIDIVKHHITATAIPSPMQNILSCPHCGYVMDKEIFDIVQNKYNFLSKKYAKQQISLLIQQIESKLEILKNEYVTLMGKMKNEESVYKESKDAYDTYLTQKGLESTFKNLSNSYENNITEQAKTNEMIKKISSELRKLSNKKEIEKKYIELATQNLLALGAWDSSYESKIKLLKPLKGQGTLTNKIILAQVVALFQTIDYLQIESNKFPFVIDSPRGNEASTISSKDILKLIFRIDCVPQTILATIDFSDFRDSIDYEGKINIVTLNRKYKLLDEDDYRKHFEEIENLHNLLSDLKNIENGELFSN